MKPLIVLLSSFGLAWLALTLLKRPHVKLAARIGMCAMLCFTAIGHFLFPEGMAMMLPEFLPFRELLIYLSGVFEFLLGIGLVLPKYSKTSGVVAIAFFLLILPVNIYASMHNINYQTGELDGPGLAYLWFRIPLQFVFIGWVYFSTVVTKEKTAQ